MKVLHFLASDSLSFRTPWLDLMCALDRRGVKQALLCAPGGNMEDTARARGIETHTCRGLVSNVPVLNPRYASIVRAVAPDIVHTRLSSAAAIAGFWNRFLGIPTLATLDKAAKRSYYDRADRCVSCSQWIKEHFVAQGYPSAHIDVVYNSIDAEKYRRDEAERARFRSAHGIAPNEKILLGAGAFRENKGFDALLHAFATLRSDGPSARLLLAGDGEERPRYLRLAETLHLRDDVIFSPGYVADIRPWMWAADAFVLPSRAEPFGIVLLEAMAAGLPVAATDDGGPPEILQGGRCGLLVPTDDVAAMAAAMRRLVRPEDDAEVQQLLENAEKRLKDFTSEALAEQLTEIYDKLLVTYRQKKVTRLL